MSSTTDRIRRLKRRRGRRRAKKGLQIDPSHEKFRSSIRGMTKIRPRITSIGEVLYDRSKTKWLPKKSIRDRFIPGTSRPDTWNVFNTQLLGMKILGLRLAVHIIIATYRAIRRRQKRDIDDIAIFYMRQARKELKPGGFKKGPRGGRVADPPAQFPHIYNRTGRLRQSLNAKSEIKTDSFTLTVTNSAPYAAALEFGNKHIGARHWMLNTFNKNSHIMKAMATAKAKRPITKAELDRRL